MEAPGEPVWTIAAACIASHAPPVAERARSYPVPASAGILPLAGLGAVAEVMVGENDGDHCLADWNRADADTGVVTPLGRDLGFVPVLVHCLPGDQDRRGGLYHEPRDYRLPGRDAAKNAAGVVRFKLGPARGPVAHLVGALFP